MLQALCNALRILPILAFLTVSFGVAARSEGQAAAVLYQEPVPLTDLELAGFHRILKTTPAQQTTAKALFDASFAELKAAEARAGVVAQKYLSLPKEQRTPSAREQHLRDVAAAEPDIPAARRRLLDDLKSLLTVEQLERWRAFESFLRREAWRTDSRGVVRSGATSLLALVDALGPDAVPADSRAAADVALERYDRELDLLIIEADRLATVLVDAQAKAAAAKRVQRSNPDASDAAQKAAVDAAWAEFNAVNRRMLLLNDSSVEAFTRFLTPEHAAELRKQYERATLPEAYGLIVAAEAVRLAPQLPGLDDSARDRLVALTREFNPTYNTFCERMAVMERAMYRAKPGERVRFPEWDTVRFARHEYVAKTFNGIRDFVTEKQHQAILMAGQREVDAQTAARSR